MNSKKRPRRPTEEVRVGGGSHRRPAKKNGRDLPNVFPFSDIEPFPRSQDILSHHSPIFWAMNKDRLLRQLLIRDIERLNDGRRLCVYHCSPQFRSPLTANDVERLYEVVADDKNSPFDLLLESAGGATDSAEAMVSMLRAINRDFRVIVPSRAKSNGTAICLAAAKIVMGVTSELGPIEPLIGEIPASLAMTPEYKQIKPLTYHAALNGFKLTRKLATDLLKTGMMSRFNNKQITRTVKMLCTRDRFHSHGSVINYPEARNLNLRVNFVPTDSPLWQRYILLHAMYEVDAALRRTVKFFEARQRSLVFRIEEGGRDEADQSAH